MNSEAGERLNPTDDVMAGIDGDIRRNLGSDAPLGCTFIRTQPELAPGELTAVAAVVGLVVAMPERLAILDLGPGRDLPPMICDLLGQAVVTGRSAAPVPAVS